MEKKWFIIVISFAVIIIIASLFIILKSPSTLASDLEQCKTLKFNGEGKTNLVFLSTKEDAEKYMNSFLQFSPYKENQNSFNFYYIDTYTPKCEIYKGIAILCYSREVVRKASSCQNDFIIVIKSEDSSIRSSSYMNVMSINSNNQFSVFAHEFGHAFANLADEYTPAKIPRKSKNCQFSCTSFENNNDGCFQGCSKENYYRSIDLGIMRTLYSSTYGKFNINLISEKIASTSTSKISSSAISELAECTAQKYYLISGKYFSEQISITDKSIETGCLGENGAGDFNYNIVLKDNSNLTSKEFNPEFIFIDSQEENENQIQGGVEQSEKEFFLKIPIIDNSKTLEISKDEQMLAQINLEDIGLRPCKN